MAAPRSLILSLLFLMLTPQARAGDAELCGRSAADPDAGIPACTRLLDHPSREADVPVLYNSRGVAKVVKGDYDSAVEDFTRALDRRPRYVDAFKNRGRARQEQGDYDKAIADFNQALHLDPKRTDLYNARGSALFDKGEYDRAIADFTKAISLDPKYKNAFVNRGLAFLHTRRIAQAIADFDVVVRLAPTPIPGAERLGGFKAILNDPWPITTRRSSSTPLRKTPITIAPLSLRTTASWTTRSPIVTKPFC